MRVRTVEIRWHDSKPITSCDFQPLPFKRARPPTPSGFISQAYKLATGGEDNHVRLWIVHPNILPQSVVKDSGVADAVPRPPRVEYLATLSRHSAAVNVVRWSPNGELIASAGDDGMIIIWTPTTSPHATSYGSDLSAEDMQYEKEHWKPRTTFRCTTMQVYDLAWSPTGEFIVAGSTDNCARIFSASDGKCLHELAEHNHYVQGVAWDPLNEYIATQSSDRSMHVYSVQHDHQTGNLEVKAVGRNSKMVVGRGRTPSRSRTGKGQHSAHNHSGSVGGWLGGRGETESDRESDLFIRDDPTSLPTPTTSQPPPTPLSLPLSQPSSAPLPPPASTPSHSVPSTPSLTGSMFPPPPTPTPSTPHRPPTTGSMSRRSSISSVAPGSPVTFASHPSLSAHPQTRVPRSPSPMPALPAIRTPTPREWAREWVNAQNLGTSGTPGVGVKLYGDEGYTNFFRRLGFSPDGGLLLTPAGQFEDPFVLPTPTSEEGSRGRKGKVESEDEFSSSSFFVGDDRLADVEKAKKDKEREREEEKGKSSVYVYTRANFARPPVARLPGHKKASVAVRFSPVLYELRGDVGGSSVEVDLEGAGTDKQVEVDIVGKPPVAETPGGVMASPALSAIDTHGPGPTASTGGPQSVFALPYRMLFAVATMDAVAIHDTQQAGPVAVLGRLHYDEFTDVAWSPDGQTLILSSRDGYCTLVIFDEILPAHHTQQQTLQLQSIAHHNSVPLASCLMTPLGTPVVSTVGLPPIGQSPSLTPVVSTRRGVEASLPAVLEEPVKRGEIRKAPSDTDTEDKPGAEGNAEKEGKEPPKKKRRAALVRVGDLGS